MRLALVSRPAPGRRIKSPIPSGEPNNGRNFSIAPVPQTHPHSPDKLAYGSYFYNAAYTCNITGHTLYGVGFEPTGIAPDTYPEPTFAPVGGGCAHFCQDSYRPFNCSCSISVKRGSPPHPELFRGGFLQINFPIHFLNLCVQLAMSLGHLVSAFLYLRHFYRAHEFYF